MNRTEPSAIFSFEVSAAGPELALRGLSCRGRSGRTCRNPVWMCILTSHPPNRPSKEISCNGAAESARQIVIIMTIEFHRWVFIDVTRVTSIKVCLVDSIIINPLILLVYLSIPLQRSRARGFLGVGIITRDHSRLYQRNARYIDKDHPLSM